VGEETIEAVTSETGLIEGARLIGGIHLTGIPGVIVPVMTDEQFLKKGNLAIHGPPAGRAKGGMRRSLMMVKPTHQGALVSPTKMMMKKRRHS